MPSDISRTALLIQILVHSGLQHTPQRTSMEVTPANNSPGLRRRIWLTTMIPQNAQKSQVSV
ncbi:MAG: hypothetical protein A2Y77_08560 [Planctomycetes bacterium RBG_13_62_9]|nr:MAG: hypothetical protein A2Y77_08560 [Planctomycetes bacterium RBG_13_62_9]